MKLSFALAAALVLPVLVDARFDPRLYRRATTAAPAQPSNPAPPAPAPSAPQASPQAPVAPSVPPPTVVPSPAAPTVSAPAAPASPAVPTVPASSMTPTPSSVSPQVSASLASSASTTNTGLVNSASSLVATNSISSVLTANATRTGSASSTSGSFTVIVKDKLTTTSSINANTEKAPANATTTKAPAPSQGQSTNTGGSSPPAPTCAPTDTCVQVAPNGQTNYSPSNFGASNGTVVTFLFPPNSGSNSVTQGDFNDPCVYLTAAGGNPAGFDSGLQNGKLFSIKVTNDQIPIYFFSKEQKLCGQGLVGAINPPTTGDTYDAYLNAAKTLGPNQNTLVDNGPVLGGLGAVAQGTPSPIPSPNSSSHLVPNSFFALLAAALGITLA